MAVWSEVTLAKLKHGFRIDSEFYKANYLKNDLIIDKHDLVQLGYVAKVTDGEHGSVKFLSDGIKYLTSENIKKGYVDIDKVRFVDKKVAERNARARVEVDDILISIKGTLGQIAIAEDWLLPANMNMDVAIVKLYNGINSIDKLFVALFLQTKYGLYQLTREGSGGVQQMITLGRLREVKVPLFSRELQKEIASQYRQALNLRNKSKSLYTQAQQLLEQELGLDKLAFEKPVGYEASFSEVINNNRADADYYQIKYLQIRKIIKKYYNGWKSLLNVANAYPPNIDPYKTPEKEFCYIELSDINSNLNIVSDFKAVLGKNLPTRAKRIVSTGDIISSSVVGSIEKTAIIGRDKNNFIASTGFFISGL